MIFMSSFLGYQHDPVLTEEEILNVHSPEGYQNVFRTGVPIKVAEDVKTGNISFVFEEVIQLNTFLFDRCNKRTASTFGQLKKRVKPLRLMAATDGLFKLITKEKASVVERFQVKCNFIVEEHLSHRSLCFSKRVDMFRFMISKEAIHLGTLHIDPQNIVEASSSEYHEDADDDKLENCELFESKDSGLNESTATEVSVLETSLAMKEEEIKSLKEDLSLTKDMVEREKSKVKKMEKMFGDSESILDQISKLASPRVVKPIIAQIKSGDDL